MKQSFFNKGQTLVEAIVVIAVVVLLVTGLIVATTFSLKNVRQNQVKMQAVTLAEQGMEIVRSLRDTNWTSFAANSGTYCLGKSGQLSTPPCPADITTNTDSFARTVQFTLNGTTMDVTVTVAATYNSSAQPVTLSSYFTQWN